MSILDTTKANIAYKLALGRAHTNNSREFFNEPENSQALVMAQNAWASAIHPTDPADPSNAGVVSSLITLNLMPVSGTDSTGKASAYVCVLGAVVPTDLVDKINPRTSAVYAPFDRVGFLIPSFVGAAYTPKLYKNGVETTPLDASDWYIDCYAGIITQETDVPAVMIDYSTGGTVDAYVYIGKTVAEAIAEAGAAAQSVHFHDKKTVGNGITGATDGVNTVYVLDNVPAAGSEHIYLNGILLRPGAGNDYELSGATITLAGYLKPTANDNFVVSYRTVG